MKSMTCMLLGSVLFATVSQAAEEEAPRFLSDEEALEISPHAKVGNGASFDSSIILDIYNRNVGNILDYLGLGKFACANPTIMTDFDMDRLEGAWYQAYASRSTDVFGCIQYQFVKDENTAQGSLKAANLQTAWTAFNTYWNPLEKGEFAHTYQLYGDVDGRLF